jgi:hypothetical protein
LADGAGSDVAGFEGLGLAHDRGLSAVCASALCRCDDAIIRHEAQPVNTQREDFSEIRRSKNDGLGSL